MKEESIEQKEQVQLNPIDQDIPNKTTFRTMQKTDERKELHTHGSAAVLFESWNKNKQKTKNTT